MTNENLKRYSGDDNRFNQQAAMWHSLMWLGIIMLVCLAWAWLLTGCSTKKSVVQERQKVESIVQDSSSVSHTSTTKQQTVHDSSSVIASEKNHWSLAFDSLLLSQVIERTTIIRQDENGTEISRETNTTITNNRERNRGLQQGSKEIDSMIRDVQDSQTSEINMSNDSVNTHWAQNKSSEQVQQEVKQELNWWQKLQLAFRVIIQVLGWLLEIGGAAYIIYIIYRVSKKVHEEIKNQKC